MALRPTYDWEGPYVASILEPDRSKLKARIDTARAAIARRVQEMNADHGGPPDERVAIQTARARLDLLWKGLDADFATPHSRKPPPWQSLYLTALTEQPPETLRKRVEDAEEAILARLQELVRDPARTIERNAIESALADLHSIKDKLGFSEPPKSV